MKLLLLFVFAVIHGCGCTGAFAQTTPNTQTVFDYLSSPVNLAKNPYARLNTLNVTVSSSPLAVKNRATGSGEIKKLASHTCNTTALNGYCDIALNDPNPEDVGKSCEYAIVYSGNASLNSIALAGVAVYPMVNQASGFTSVRIVRPCESTSPTLRILQTTAGTGSTIKYGVYAGPATNIGTVAQSYFFGGMDQAGASGCTYLENTSSGLNNFVDLGTGTGCNPWTTSGPVTAVGTNDHRMTVSSMPAGVYKIELAGNFNAGGAQVCNFRLSDGTNSYQPQMIAATGSMSTPNLTFSVPYTSPQSSTTFKIQASDTGAAACSLDPSSAGLNTSWKIYYFPSQAQTVVRVENLDYAPRSYTPTFTGFGTVTTHNCKAGRSGAFLKLNCNFVTGTTTAVEARVSLPPGLVTPANTFAPSIVGTWDTSPVTATVYKSVLIENSTGYVTFGYNINTTSGLTKQTGSSMNGAGATISFNADIPIEGWTSNSNGTMVLPGMEPVSLRYQNVAGTSIGTGTVTPIPFTTKDWDSYNAWDGTTFRPPFNGKYCITPKLYFASAAWTVAAKSITVRKNGVLDAYAVINTPAAAYTNDLGLSGTAVVDAVTTDLITIAMNHNEGSAKSLSNAAVTNTLSIVKCGN